MVSISKYWQLVKLNSTGSRRVETMIAAKTYFQNQFPEWTQQVNVADTTIQRQLWQQMQQGGDIKSDHRFLAESCLRCYISHQIDQACLDLGVKFGSRHGFTYEDLLPFVLDDEGLLSSNSQQSVPYRSLAMTILQTFDPAKGTLNTWVTRYVRQHPELKRFLLQHGVYIVSDWALLNDTTSKRLQQILAQVYQLTEIEIQQTCELLQSFHAVYREDRLKQRIAKTKQPCQPPTSEQLVRIADDLKACTSRTLNPEAILRQLNAIASKLRRYRISAQGGTVPTVSFDQPEIQPFVDRAQVDQDDEEKIEFLKYYQNQFIECLDQAILQVISDSISKLQRKRSSVEQLFITALHLFHCQGQSMSQIAPQIGFQKQYEVTRLLKLNDLRADIRQRLLVMLRSRIVECAKMYANSERLQSLDQQVEVILDEQITSIIQEAESEAKNPVRNQPLRGLLARRICSYLDSRNPNL
ncbi:hypothetical protein BZZ01_15615 [Nostocales cyanobacterium HT-58-2]|nr:hypothetical protein BZZ01_15615 [Nostocales cyanobacterium HT-58-2]